MANADRHRDEEGVAQLLPEMVQVEVISLEHDFKVLQRGVLRPEEARGCGVAWRNRKQHHVINGEQSPKQHRDADQQQLGFGGYIFQAHFDSLFIMK